MDGSSKNKSGNVMVHPPNDIYIYDIINIYIYIYNSTNTEMNMAVQINYNKLIKPTCPVVIIKH